jgi:hypothetical protein
LVYGFLDGALAAPGFRIGGSFAGCGRFCFGCGRLGRRLLGIKIGRLQWRRCGLAGLIRGLLLAAL